jgi:hypothetical protein
MANSGTREQVVALRARIAKLERQVEELLVERELRKPLTVESAARSMIAFADARNAKNA